jgi:hypothetical protein
MSVRSIMVGPLSSGLPPRADEDRVVITVIIDREAARHPPTLDAHAQLSAGFRPKSTVLGGGVSEPEKLATTCVPCGNDSGWSEVIEAGAHVVDHRSVERRLPRDATGFGDMVREGGCVRVIE